MITLTTPIQDGVCTCYKVKITSFFDKRENSTVTITYKMRYEDSTGRVWKEEGSALNIRNDNRLDSNGDPILDYDNCTKGTNTYKQNVREAYKVLQAVLNLQGTVS